MTEGTFILAVLSSFWLGILTSISPCPLATNIAAVTYIARKIGSPRSVIFSGLLYTAGRALVYFGLAFILVSGLLSAPLLSMFLQRYIVAILGPVLI
jgi:cytochrome c biogenesis protein CcdA